MLPILFGVFFLFLVPSQSFCSEPSIQIQLSSDQIALNEEASISIETSEKASQVLAPQTENFDLIYGGSSQSFQTSIINGKASSKNSFLYQFVLRPKKNGVFEIGAFQVKIGQKAYQTQSFRIKVLRESRKRASSPADPFSQIEEFFKNSRPKTPQIFLKAVLKPSSVFQNQQSLMELYFYSSEKEVFDYELKEVNPIRSDKVAVYDLSDQIDSFLRKEGGYFRKLIRRYALYPISPAKIAIAPPVFVLLSPYGQLQISANSEILESVPIQNKKGLPYVGELFVKIKISTNQIEAGKTMDVLIEMRGDGNLKTLSNPYSDLKEEDLYISSPVSEVKFDRLLNGRANFKQEIHYSLIAQKAGSFQIPEIFIDYYDHFLRQRRLSLPGFSFSVFDSQPAAANKIWEFRAFGQPRPYRFLMKEPLFMVLIFVLLLLPLATYLYGKHRKRMVSDSVYFRKFLADKKLSTYLAEAKNALEQKRYQDFYLALQKGVFYYLTDKWNISRGIGSKELLTYLREKGLNESLLSLFQEIYQDCGSNAYSGRNSEADSERVLRKAKEFFEKVR